MNTIPSQLRQRLADFGQAHVLRFWDELSPPEQDALLAQLGAVDLALMKRLIEQWVLREPVPEAFTDIRPLPVIPKADLARPGARAAWDAGEELLGLETAGNVREPEIIRWSFEHPLFRFVNLDGVHLASATATRLPPGATSLMDMLISWAANVPLFAMT